MGIDLTVACPAATALSTAFLDVSTRGVTPFFQVTSRTDQSGV
jgi:hypothetical protein